MPSKKSADAAAEPEVQGDLASGSVSAAPEAAAGEPPQAVPHAPAAARFVALRNLIRNGREYFPGDEVDMTPDRYFETNERLFAEHVAELKASGAIKEA